MFENLGFKLKSLRLNQNLSRRQVAELVGVSESMIGLCETGERIPSLPLLLKLSAQYKVSLDYLLDNNTKNINSLSLEGLTDQQIRALKLTADCFRNQNRT